MTAKPYLCTSLVVCIDKSIILRLLHPAHRESALLCLRILSNGWQKANHNLITYFPEDIGKTVIEELNLEHNRLEAIPSELFMKASKYVLRKYLLLNAIYFINTASVLQQTT
jgi:hypothetical protein